MKRGPTTEGFKYWTIVLHRGKPRGITLTGWSPARKRPNALLLADEEVLQANFHMIEGIIEYPEHPDRWYLKLMRDYVEKIIDNEL